jgi:hypothetical protein
VAGLREEQQPLRERFGSSSNLGLTRRSMRTGLHQPIVGLIVG